MNQNMLPEPSKEAKARAKRISKVAQRLVNSLESEASDNREWPNRENLETARTNLMAYIAKLENP